MSTFMPAMIRYCCAVWGWLLLASLWVTSAVAAAGEPLEKSLAAIIDGPEFRNSHWGVLVTDAATGNVLYERNADKLFAPASVTKLFSVAAALDALGGDFRFKTPVYALGDVKNGELQGDLVLVASGDPTMGGRTDKDGHVVFRNTDHTYAGFSADAELTEPDPLAGLKHLARQVRESGIRVVTGDVLIDDRMFDRAEGTGSGPRRLTPIIINDNVVDFTITPTKENEPARVEWRPKASGGMVDALVKTVGPNERPQVNFAATGETIVLRGSIPAGRKPLVAVFEPSSPPDWARTLWIDALRSEGVIVAASPAMAANRGRLPLPDRYKNMKPVAVFTSPPFREHARLILKVSHNLHASTLPLLLAARDGQRTLADGLKLQGDFLQRAGVDVASISFGGGAGGDRADYVTPRATVELLRYMRGREDFADYRNALPVLGVDGTLAEVVSAESPAQGKFQAKTGTLVWHDTMNNRQLLNSKALAGYGVAASGREIVLAMFVNQVPLGDAPEERQRIGRVLGRICEALHAGL